jgi:anti-anti-sigma factor
MEIRQSKNNNHALLNLNGRFDFKTHKGFKETYTILLEDVTILSIEVNMSGVEYLDSSALGMLLMLRERTIAANKKLSLSSPNPTVQQILEIANFQKLFTII